MQVYSGTFAIMGLISCFSIGYSYAKNGAVASRAFLPSLFIPLKSPTYQKRVKDWRCDCQGLVCGHESLAILIGLAVGSIYTIFIQKHIVIKMPEQVLKRLLQFEAMTPAFRYFLLS